MKTLSLVHDEIKTKFGEICRGLASLIVIVMITCFTLEISGVWRPLQLNEVFLCGKLWLM